MPPSFSRLPAVILFLSMTFHGKAQVGWSEVKSDIVNATSSIDIRSVVTDQAGNAYASMQNGVYKWNDTAWSLLGQSYELYAPSYLAVDPKGNIYAVPDLTDDSGSNYVARWNGQKWEEVGTGSHALKANSSIMTITFDQAGNLYAAGEFVDEFSTAYVAKWNGTDWIELGGINSLNPNGSVGYIWSVITDPAGNVYAAGNFKNSSGHRFVAKWNGSSWSELGAANPLNANGFIYCLTIDPSGNIYAGGLFVNSAGYEYVAKWDGSSWTEVGAGNNSLKANDAIDGIVVDKDYNIYAGGDFSKSNYVGYIAKWDGTSWSEVRNGTDSLNTSGGVHSMAVDPLGNLYAAGGFVNKVGDHIVEEWIPRLGQWKELTDYGVGIFRTDGITKIANDDLGNLYVAGTFENATYHCYVARWNGSRWSETGGDTTTLNANGTIETMVGDHSGHSHNIYAGGKFTNAAGKYYVAQWDGKTWSELGGPNSLHANSYILDLAVDGAGNVYAAGWFTDQAGHSYVAKWDGTEWTEVGDTDPHIGVIRHLAVDLSGNVYINGSSTTDETDYSNIVKWNGSNWIPVNDDLPGIDKYGLGFIVPDRKGNIYTIANYGLGKNGVYAAMAKWDGVQWTMFEGGTLAGVSFMTTDTANNFYMFANSHPLKWDGQQVTNLGSLYGNLDGFYGLSLDPHGTLYGVGDFTTPTGDVFNIARYDPLGMAQPIITSISNKCQSDPTSKGQIANPPVNGSVSISEDGVSLPYNPSDSSFVYYSAGSTTAGGHTVTVTFSNTGHILSVDTSYAVGAHSTPEITIQGSTQVLAAQPTTLFATISDADSATLQWKDSTADHAWSSISGATGTTLIYFPQNSSRVRCDLTSNDHCASAPFLSSNVLTFIIRPPIDSSTANPTGIRIYPNPVISTLSLGPLNPTDNWQTAEIVNIDGNTVKSDIPLTGQLQISIDVSSLQSGYYVCKLYGSLGTILLKFMKL